MPGLLQVLFAAWSLVCTYKTLGLSQNWDVVSCRMFVILIFIYFLFKKTKNKQKKHQLWESNKFKK